MADISKQLNALAAAKTGAEMRMPISQALQELYDKGRNADTLSGFDGNFSATQLALASDMDKLLPMDIYPTQGSKKLAMSGGIFAMIGDLSANYADWGGIGDAVFE